MMAPHYVHLFEQVFAQPRPWVFGHLYLPGGSKSLGAPSHALASGSKAPLVGVLMQVTRAVRLRDGKFLLLATALARFKVRQRVKTQWEGATSRVGGGAGAASTAQQYSCVCHGGCSRMQLACEGGGPGSLFALLAEQDLCCREMPAA